MNRTIRAVVSTFGVTLAIGGMSHGIFETLQGNTPTGGMFINAIGPEHIRWEYGGEGAFTLIPNFLITGIAVLLVAVTIVVWSLVFVHRKRGPLVFILLFVALVLVGGGIGQIPLFLVAWALSTRINKPLTWWRRVLPERARGALAGLWVWFLVPAVPGFLLALEIAIFGYLPGVSDPERLLNITFGLLGLSLLLFCLAFVAACARDISRQPVVQ